MVLYSVKYRLGNGYKLENIEIIRLNFKLRLKVLEAQIRMRENERDSEKQFQ